MGEGARTPCPPSDGLLVTRLQEINVCLNLQLFIIFIIFPC